MIDYENIKAQLSKNDLTFEEFNIIYSSLKEENYTNSVIITTKIDEGTLHEYTFPNGNPVTDFIKENKDLFNKYRGYL